MLILGSHAWRYYVVVSTLYVHIRYRKSMDVSLNLSCRGLLRWGSIAWAFIRHNIDISSLLFRVLCRLRSYVSGVILIHETG